MYLYKDMYITMYILTIITSNYSDDKAMQGAPRSQQYYRSLDYACAVTMVS